MKRFHFTRREQIIAEALVSIVLDLSGGYFGIAFTLIVMGIHLYHEQKRGNRK